MKKILCILLSLGMLFALAGCNESNDGVSYNGNTNTSAGNTKGYTEEQLIKAFMDNGYSVAKEDFVAEDLGYSSAEVNVIGISFERENDGLSDFGDLLYAEFPDTVGSIQFYRRCISRLEDDDYTFDKQSGEDWDYASGMNEGPYWYNDNGWIVSRTGNYVIMMLVTWEDYLDADEPFDYLPMIITEDLCRP